MKSSLSFRFGVGVIASLGLAAGAMVPQDPDPKSLAVERYGAALQVWENLAKAQETLAERDTRALWSRRLAEAAAESGALPARDAFAQHLARMEEMLDVVKAMHDAGRRSTADIAVAQFYVAEAKSLAKR